MKKSIRAMLSVVFCLAFLCACTETSNSNENSTLTQSDVINLLDVYHDGGILKNNCSANDLNENFLYFFYENVNCKNITSADTSVSFDEFEKYLSKYFDISQMDFGKLYSYNAEDNTIKISAAYNPLSTCIFDDYKISDDTLEIFYHLKFLIRNDNRCVYKKITLVKNHETDNYLFDNVATLYVEKDDNKYDYGYAADRYISDDNLINITKDIAENRNYTLWLLSPDLNYYTENEILPVQLSYTFNGETYTSTYTYAPVWEFDNIQDFTDCAKKYLSAEYVENYLLPLLDGPDCLLDVPMLKDINGKLYIQTSPNGTSIVPCFDYIKGEIIERGDTTAIVRLYTDPDKYDPDSYYPEYYDYTMIYENNGWRYNPHL